MPGFTQEPWRYNADDEVIYVEREFGDEPMIASLGGASGTPIEEEAERQANAALIVAAKPLYEACRQQHEAIDWLAARLAQLDRSFRPTQTPIVIGALRAGNAAIELAEKPCPENPQ